MDPCSHLSLIDILANILMKDEASELPEDIFDDLIAFLDDEEAEITYPATHAMIQP
jgi:hypothetical protein